MSGMLSGMFQSFTKRTRLVLSLAQDEAQQLNHTHIGTEHLLLGLVREGDGIAARALQNLGVDLAAVRQAVLRIIGRGDRIVMGDIGLTPRAKMVIELAVEETRRLNHQYVGTEHLLLGLIRESQGIAAGVLVNQFAITYERARAEILRMLAQRRTDKTATEASGPKSNVVTCRLDDAAVNALDALVEAGIRSTRSDAAAWLINAGIEAHRELFDRVNTTVNEIRKLRLEARDIARQVTHNAAEGASQRETPDTSAYDEGEVENPEEPEDLSEPPPS